VVMMIAMAVVTTVVTWTVAPVVFAHGSHPPPT